MIRGDSGGPLLIADTNTNEEKFILAGVTSFGGGCDGTKPGVYTKITKYLDWIEYQMSHNESTAIFENARRNSLFLILVAIFITLIL